MIEDIKTTKAKCEEYIQKFKVLKIELDELKKVPPLERMICFLQHVIRSGHFLDESLDFTSNLSDLVRDSNYNAYNVNGVDDELFKLKRTIDDSETKYISDFIQDYIHMVTTIIHSFKFDNVRILSENGIPIINNGNVFTISILFFKLEVWKELVLYELESLKDKRMIEPTICKFKSLLDDLEYRLGIDDIPNIEYYKLFPEEDFDINPLILRIKDFTHRISSYKEILNEIDAEKVILNSKDRIRQLILKEEKYRKRIDSELRMSKLSLRLKKDIKKVRKGLLFLLKKNNKKIDFQILKNTANKLIQSIIHVPQNESISFNIPLFIKIDKITIIEFVLFLKKESYFVENYVSIPKILESNIDLKFKGFSTKNIYRILQERKDRKLNFGNLTSEIALKNEMTF